MTDRSRWRQVADRAALPALTAVTVLAVVAAAVLGVSWARASGDPAVETARTRDAVLETAKKELVAINTIDWRAPDGGLGAWQQQVTGPLAAQVGKNRKDNVGSIREAKTVTRARVVDAAATRVDQRAGQADVLAALEVAVAPDGGRPITKRSRLAASLARTPQGWKLASVQVVGLNA